MIHAKCLSLPPFRILQRQIRYPNEYTLLRRIIFSDRTSELGQNPPRSPALVCLLPPGADTVRGMSVLAKPRNSACNGQEQILCNDRDAE
jgi:hypothetical protein